MNPIVVLALAVPAAFGAGVVFHKYVISEAVGIKQHVTASEERIRTDVANALKGLAGKI
jgi:hypothetical protein